MIKCVLNGNISVWSLNENGDIISITNDGITVQGTDKAEFVIAEKGKTRNISVDFSQKTVRVIK